MRNEPFKYSQVCLSKSAIISNIIECPTSNLILIYPNLIFALRECSKKIFYDAHILISDTISLKKKKRIYIYIFFFSSFFFFKFLFTVFRSEIKSLVEKKFKLYCPKDYDNDRTI